MQLSYVLRILACGKILPIFSSAERVNGVFFRRLSHNCFFDVRRLFTLSFIGNFNVFFAAMSHVMKHVELQHCQRCLRGFLPTAISVYVADRFEVAYFVRGCVAYTPFT